MFVIQDGRGEEEEEEGGISQPDTLAFDKGWRVGDKRYVNGLETITNYLLDRFVFPQVCQSRQKYSGISRWFMEQYFSSFLGKE